MNYTIIYRDPSDTTVQFPLEAQVEGWDTVLWTVRVVGARNVLLVRETGWDLAEAPDDVWRRGFNVQNWLLDVAYGDNNSPDGDAYKAFYRF